MEKESRSNATFPQSLRKDRRLQFHKASVLMEIAQRLYTSTVRGKLYIAYKYDNGDSFKVNLNDFRSLLILGGVLISFEIMLNSAQISRFKFADCLFYYAANPSALVPATLHILNPARLLRFSYSLLFLVSGTLVTLFTNSL